MQYYNFDMPKFGLALFHWGCRMQQSLLLTIVNRVCFHNSCFVQKGMLKGSWNCLLTRRSLVHCICFVMVFGHMLTNAYC